MSPRRLILVRHGESTGNVAREQAEASAADVIDIGLRDPDVPLSELGQRQARSLGCWLAELDSADQPTEVWSSPYRRAVQTAAEALDAGGFALPIGKDERLRDRELGILDLLTSSGVRNRYPAEATRRRWLGKLYYRPPGGESWADVVLRLRSFLADLDRRLTSGPLLIVCHDAVILLFRYILENLDETELFELARAGSIRNAAVTTLHRADGAGWQAVVQNDDDHLRRFGVSTAEHPGEREGLHG
ncbi:MAG: histidine phosphatase family protein [Jatrophihabitantaceae bacterium]